MHHCCGWGGGATILWLGVQMSPPSIFSRVWGGGYLQWLERGEYVPTILAVTGVEGLDTYNGWTGVNRCPPSSLWLGWRDKIITVAGKERIGARHL